MLLVAVFGACGSHTEVRRVNLYEMDSCVADPTSAAQFVAGGDFAGESPPILQAQTVGVPLPFNPSIQALVVNVGAEIGGGFPLTFWAAGTVAPAGDVNVLLWSTQQPCKATQRAVASSGGSSLGLVDAQHLLLVSGSSPPFLFNLSTGTNLRLDTQLQTPREGATITPFGGGALVTGGQKPLGMVPIGFPEVFTLNSDGSSGSFAVFAPGAEFLSSRSLGAAVVLPTGETVLFGGYSLPGMLNTSIETVSPNPNAPAVTTWPNMLRAGRSSPTVIRLTNGQLFVGGGFDTANRAVPTGEWFDPVSMTYLGTQDFTPPSGPAPDGGTGPVAGPYLYAPLEGGMVLGVIGGVSNNNVLVIPPCDASSGPCTPKPVGGVALGPTQPVAADANFFPAAHSAPVLWTGTAWLRWDPWEAQFEQMAAQGVSIPGPSSYAAATADPGLAVWIGGDSFPYGFRYDTRGPFVNDVALGSSNTAPDGVVLSPDYAAWVTTGDAGDAELSVGHGVKVFLTDATFETVTIGATMSGWADIIFRDETGCEYEIGGSPSFSCPGTVNACPPFAAISGATLTASRVGAQVTVTDASTGQLGKCNPGFAANARVAIGFHGGNGPLPVQLQNLTVTRGP